MKTNAPYVVLALLATGSWEARAHYLWITVDEETPTIARIYFEERPKPGDGHYLDDFGNTMQAWETPANGPSVSRKLSDVRERSQRWLQATLEGDRPRTVDGYGKFGVYAYQDTHVLLHYYARHVGVESLDELDELTFREDLALRITPRRVDQALLLTVEWRGEPIADRPVFVTGPSGIRETHRTNAEGRLEWSQTSAGVFTFRTFVEEPIAGTDDGEAFSKIRHNGTLIVDLNPADD